MNNFLYYHVVVAKLFFYINLNFILLNHIFAIIGDIKIIDFLRVHYLKTFNLYGNSIFYGVTLFGITFLSIAIAWIFFRRRTQRKKGRVTYFYIVFY